MPEESPVMQALRLLAAQKAQQQRPPLAMLQAPLEGGIQGLLGLLGLGDDASQANRFGAMMAAALPLGAAAKGLKGAVAAERAPGIRAYHGSPHDFEKFELSPKTIGTGEGAQAYGHGLYFAGNEGVAKKYRDELGTVVPSFGDQPVKTSAESMAHDILSRMPKSVAGPEANMRRAMQTVDEWADAGVFRGPNEGKAILDVKRAIAENFDKPLSKAVQGKMYEVNINAHPDQMLDWDKPLNQQSPHVQAALAKAGVKPSPQAWNWEPYQVTAEDVAAHRVGPAMRAGEWTVVQKDASGVIQYHVGTTFHTPQAAEGIANSRNAAIPLSARDRGEALYRDLQSAQGKTQASTTLQQAGIPGIKYLDQGSRSAGQGTSNYVVFDDNLIDILRKYGVAIAATLGGGYQMQQQEQP